MDNARFQHLVDEIHYAVIDGYYDLAKRAICRTAAEISGLLAWKVSDMVDQVILEEDRQALRRFAELAKEE